jgi:hypothetical protein
MISAKLTQNPNMWKLSVYPPKRPMYFKTERDALQFIDNTKGLANVYVDVVYMNEGEHE